MMKWRKAEASVPNGECVEIAEDGRHILVRDSKDKGSGQVLRFTRGEFGAWLAGCRAGEFDDLT